MEAYDQVEWPDYNPDRKAVRFVGEIESYLSASSPEEYFQTENLSGHHHYKFSRVLGVVLVGSIVAGGIYSGVEVAVQLSKTMQQAFTLHPMP
jgi:hypothetical protein